MKEDALEHGEYDTIFIGSSRIYRQIIPAVFDKQMQKFGAETHSFNFGFDGMRPPESFYYATRLLSQRRRPLKWVFVELCPIYTGLNQRNAVGGRTFEWHDPRNTLLVWQENSRTRRLWPDGLLLDALHFESFVLREADVAGGQDLLTFLNSKTARLEKVPTEWREQAGFCADQRRPASGPKRAGLVAALEAAITTHFSPLPAPQNLIGPLRDLTERIKGCGARPVFVVMPTGRPQENLGGLREQGIDADLLSLADPGRFPELFSAGIHADMDHLVGQGPTVLTADFAREFARVSGMRDQSRGIRRERRRDEDEDEEREERERRGR